MVRKENHFKRQTKEIAHKMIFALRSLFNGISTFVGYLMPKSTM